MEEVDFQAGDVVIEVMPLPVGHFSYESDSPATRL